MGISTTPVAHSRHEQPGKASKPRARTFTGCQTCRSRHAKCDEARPTCATCKRLNLVCKGYLPQLQWMHREDADACAREQQHHRACSFRYPLFDEQTRHLMSRDLVESLGNKSAGSILSELDTKLVTRHHHHHMTGPFGVFRACEDLDALCPPQTSLSAPEAAIWDLGALIPPADTSQQSSSLPRVEHALDACEAPHHIGQYDDTKFSFQASAPLNHDELLLLPAINVMDMTDGAWIGLLAEELCVGVNDQGLGIATSPPAIVSPHHDLLPSPAMPVSPFEPESSLSSASDLATSAEYVPSPQMSYTRARLESPKSGLPGGTSVLPAHTAVLLHHLKTKVFACSASDDSVETRVSPWKLLLLPCALQAFAEISIFTHASHTRLSVLSTLLAKSAFHLHEVCMTDKSHTSLASIQWDQVAFHHQINAEMHLQMALGTEFGGAQQAEYIELLMAILGVLLGQMNRLNRFLLHEEPDRERQDTAVAFDNGAFDTPQLLRHAERLIRKRGLPSPKSYNLRVLHHVYTHLRVIAESTSVTSTKTNGSLRDPNFRTREENLGNLDISQNKPDDIGYNDIHLDVSGHWRFTLYLDIYGVPESLMTLLSQIISLVNEKPMLDVTAKSNGAVATALAQHVKILEHQLWSWSPQKSGLQAGPSRPIVSTSSDGTRGQRPESRSLIGAVHQALIIYFYRRVYCMSAMIIQDQVRKTLDFVDLCPSSDILDQDFALTLGWALFICACEAATTELQCRAARYLEALDRYGVCMSRASRPSSIVKSLWNQREQTGNFALSWAETTLQEAH